MRYRVRPGDTLTSIAAKYHVSIQAIMVANRLRRDTIYDGEELIIP
jgi:membrane-bound lytic murein transglycosylase D